MNNNSSSRNFSIAASFPLGRIAIHDYKKYLQKKLQIFQQKRTLNDQQMYKSNYDAKQSSLPRTKILTTCMQIFRVLPNSETKFHENIFELCLYAVKKFKYSGNNNLSYRNI